MNGRKRPSLTRPQVDSANNHFARTLSIWCASLRQWSEPLIIAADIPSAVFLESRFVSSASARSSLLPITESELGGARYGSLPAVRFLRLIYSDAVDQRRTKAWDPALDQSSLVSATNIASRLFAPRTSSRTSCRRRRRAMEARAQR
jgi:hypothetical protein